MQRSIGLETGNRRPLSNPGFGGQPLSPQDAMENVDALLQVPHRRVLSEVLGFWEVFKTLTAREPIRGNLVPNAHLAAILKQHGVKTLYTRDKRFRNFGFLDLRDPLS